MTSLIRRCVPVAKRVASSRMSFQARSFAAAASKSVKELTTKEEYLSAKEALGADGCAIFDFTAVWCGPCKMISPVYEQLASDRPDISFYKLDIDNPALIEAVTSAQISAVPTFIGYKGGRFVGEFTGADRAKLRDLVEKLTTA